ncbi:MAG: SHOCT domain-containing protein [Sulfuricaulis sp.]
MSAKIILPMTLMTAVLGGCMVTDVKHASYEETKTSSVQQLPPTLKAIAIGNFTDGRNAPERLLCVVLNDLNVTLKRLEVDEPVADVVRDDFREALAARGIKESKDAPYEVQGTIDQLGCIYKWGKEFSADITVSVVALPSRQVVFSQKYSTHRVERGMGAGIAADTDALLKSEEDTISATVDKALADPSLLAAVSGLSGTPAPASAESAFSLKDRLKKLDELHKQGLISDSEYAAKRKELLDSL